ncbi:hypothetical protein N9D61_03815 [Planktomarina sp.]|nr:hypothetical protein [Planktomarina sp.]
MAVVQISRIQVRRGKKGETNLPQLASGELGWAIDAQELYIGNGSVSEGAPAVGNTKILTSADNIFDISDQYEYRKNDSIIETGATARSPVRKTLQERLDDEVYVSNFGAVDDDSIVQTAALQRAIDNLFLNTKTTPENRRILKLAPGLYRIDNSLKLPPYTTLVGSGKDKTIIEQTANSPIFITVNSSSTIGNYDETSGLSAANQARHISVSGMTLRYENAASNIYNTAINLQSVEDGHFYDLKLKGYWDGDGIQAASIGINIKSFSGSVRSKRNLFENIDIEGFAYGINSSFDIEDNTFRDITFSTLLNGVRLGNGMPAVDYDDAADLADKLGDGVAYGPNNTLVENCTFREIFEQGFIVNKGSANTSKRNRYFDVGNDGGTSATTSTSIVKFDTIGNETIEDWFERTYDLGYNQDYVNVNNSNSNNSNQDLDGPKYIPEVEGLFNYSQTFVHSIVPISTNGNWVTGFRLPANQSRSFEIPYQYNSVQVNGTRRGTLYILIDKENDEISVTDDFEFIGLDSGINGNAINLTFRGKLVNITSGVVGDTTVETAYIEFKNATTESSITPPSLTYTITSRS